MELTQEDYELVNEAQWNADPSIPDAEKFRKVTTDDLTDEERDMCHNLAGWKNSLYEATMSDYSIDSITNAERQVEAAEAELEAALIDPDSVVVWSEARGLWTLA